MFKKIFGKKSLSVPDIGSVYATTQSSLKQYTSGEVFVEDILIPEHIFFGSVEDGEVIPITIVVGGVEDSELYKKFEHYLLKIIRSRNSHGLKRAEVKIKVIHISNVDSEGMCSYNNYYKLSRS